MKKTLAILALLVSATLSFGWLSATYSPVSYDCNGSVQAFSFPYTFFETTDLSVYVVTSNGVSTLLEEGAGAGKYTIYAANADYSDGATITAGTAYDSGNRIVISREIPYGQGLVIPSKPLEQALDKLAGQVQQVKDSVGRTVTAPVTDPSGLDIELPVAESRAGKMIIFDASGNLTVQSPLDSGTLTADETTLTVNSTVFSVKDGGIDTAQIADNAVGTSQIATGAVTTVKMATMANMKVLGNVSGASATPAEVAIIDDDTMATAASNNLASAESIKAYADTGDKVLQVVTAQTQTKVYQASAVIPNDVSIPQNTEGLEVFDVAITPKSTTSTLVIDGTVSFGSYGGHHVVSIFQDTTTNAIATFVIWNNVNNYEESVPFSYKVSSASTAARNYKVRIGTEAGGVTLNGKMNNTVLFGGTLTSTMKITEIQ